MRVLTNERYKVSQTGFLFYHLGHAPGMGLGCPGGQKYSNMVMWHIKLTGMSSRTECKQNFHSSVELVTLGRGQNVKYLISVTKSISKTFISKLCFVCVLTNKR